MTGLTKKIEVSANIAIIVVAILLCVLLVRKYFLPSQTPAQTQAQAQARAQVPPTIPAGTKVPMTGVDWSKNGKTLLLVLQKGCRFCSESAPFYQRLVRETSEHSDVQLVAALPQDVNEGKQYLSDLGVQVNEVKQASLSSIGVMATPTILLVDKNGVITESWIGKLPPDGEASVLSHL
jgi:thioredoxin-related protein